MAEEPTINSLILDKLDLTATALSDRLDATEKNLGRRLDDQDRALEEIKRQTQRTNGRVTALENARARAQGVVSAYRWVPSAMTAVLTAGLTILVMALTGGIH